MQPQPLSSEEIKARKREDIYIQEGKNTEIRIARARLVAEARVERTKQAELLARSEP
jgi:hypothetical protein